MGKQVDLSDLDGLIENLHALADVPSKASRQAADGIEEAIQKQFDDGTDPYGEEWAPLAESTLARTPNRNGGPLDNTSAMRDGIVVAPMSGAGVSITFEDKGDIAQIHQTGATYKDGHTMPARKILPEEELPESWEEAIAEAVHDAAERTIKRR